MIAATLALIMWVATALLLQAWWAQREHAAPGRPAVHATGQHVLQWSPPVLITASRRHRA